MEPKVQIVAFANSCNMARHALGGPAEISPRTPSWWRSPIRPVDRRPCPGSWSASPAMWTIVRSAAAQPGTLTPHRSALSLQPGKRFGSDLARVRIFHMWRA